ncbi:MAG TPA: dTDP-4-dehydrorhamnose reductase [Gemmataceae bacterium]|nr:dTDP-4-dehydrorhamnose reductase [Gemmataceae bacterium]
MKYALLGAGGQLGHDLQSRLPGQVAAWTRAQADLTQPAAMRAAVEALRPDVVVNCAAYNLVDKAESDPAAAFAVNAWGVRDLAMTCRDLDCTLVHFSTDYVFGLDHSRRAPWTETDAPGPVSVYGLSKLSGEYLVRAICPRHFVVRTCGLYGVWGAGGKGGNFVETMLRRASEGKPLRVVQDQWCSPTYTADLAAAAASLTGTDSYGLYHLTNSGSCSWYDFAEAILETAGVQGDLAPITSREFGAAARRPTYSVLARTGYERLGLPAMRPWREALTAYLDERRWKNRT